MKRQRECPKCHKMKPLDTKHFNRDRKRSNGFASWCKICVDKKKTAWVAVNPAKAQVAQKRYRAHHAEAIATRDKAYRVKNAERLRAKNRAYAAANKRRMAAARLLRVYGITQEEWTALFESQGRNCATCRRDFAEPKPGVKVVSAARPQLDHDHVTGKVRGILCGRCNRALGLLEDDIALLAACSKYLKRASCHANR